MVVRERQNDRGVMGGLTAEVGGRKAPIVGRGDSCGCWVTGCDVCGVSWAGDWSTRFKGRRNCT